MCGLLYLPRLFVYHVNAKKNGELDKALQTMERKLLRIIMNPAMIFSFIFGFWLIYSFGFAGGWLHFKLFLVSILAIFHGFLAKCRKDFSLHQNKHSEKFYRIINEIPALLLIGIILLVIIKPFE